MFFFLFSAFSSDFFSYRCWRAWINREPLPPPPMVHFILKKIKSFCFSHYSVTFFFVCVCVCLLFPHHPSHYLICLFLCFFFPPPSSSDEASAWMPLHLPVNLFCCCCCCFLRLLLFCWFLVWWADVSIAWLLLFPFLFFFFWTLYREISKRWYCWCYSLLFFFVVVVFFVFVRFFFFSPFFPWHHYRTD